MKILSKSGVMFHIDTSKIKSIFGVSITTNGYEIIDLYSESCKLRSVAYLGDAILRLAIYNYSVYRDLKFGDYVYCESNRHLSETIKHSGLVISDYQLDDKFYGTAFEIILGIIFLQKRNRDIGLQNAIDAAIYALFGVTQCRVNNYMVVNYSYRRKYPCDTKISEMLTEVFFRRCYIVSSNPKPNFNADVLNRCRDRYFGSISIDAWHIMRSFLGLTDYVTSSIFI